MALTTENPNAKQATPQQQAQFDMLLDRARQLMGATDTQWIAGLKADPVEASVQMGTAILRKLAMSSEKSGQKVDPVVLLNVGVQFVKDIASVANAAGAVSDEQLPGFLKEVLSQSIMAYLKQDAQDGLMSKQEAQGMLAKMQGDGDGQDPESAQEDATEERGEPAGDGPGADNTPGHENAETPAVEGQEGDEEDQMNAQLMAIRKAKGVAK